MRMIIIGLGLVCLFASDVSAEPIKGKSSPPFIYAAHYGYNHVGNAGFLKRVADNSTYLMHVAHDNPFISSLGANSDYTDNRLGRLLNPEEVSQRIKDITAYVDSIHKAGVKIFIPYIGPHTLMGDAEKRKGFWEFYDHWDDYSKFGFGPKPKEDPIDWNQRKADGSLRGTYAMDSKEWMYRRYLLCINNPNFQPYFLNVARHIAKCGYDGVFLDNCTTYNQLCHCQHCQRKFIAYMKGRYTLAEIKELFSVNDYSQLKLAYSGKNLLSWESRRFQSICMRDLLARLRRIGEEITGKDFIVIINRGPHDFAEIVMDAVDWKMSETGYEAKQPTPSAKFTEVIPGVTVKEYKDYILDYKYVHAAARNNNGKMVLLAYGSRGPNLLELGLAESAAFGEGGVLCGHLGGGKLTASYSSFFKKHRELYDELSVYTDIGVVVFNTGSVALESHSLLAKLFKENNIPFNFIPRHSFDDASLRGYKLIVLSNVRYMSDKEVEILLNYLRSGGKAIIVGETGTYDEKWRKRKDNPLILKTGDNQAAIKKYKKGKLFYIPSLDEETSLPVLTKAFDFPLSVTPGIENEGVRVNVLFKEGKLVTHLVNYNVTSDDKVTLVKDIPISIELPSSWKQKKIKVSCYTPGKEGKINMKFNIKKNRINFTVPYLKIYKVITIEHE